MFACFTSDLLSSASNTAQGTVENNKPSRASLKVIKILKKAMNHFDFPITDTLKKAFTHFQFEFELIL